MRVNHANRLNHTTSTTGAKRANSASGSFTASSAGQSSQASAPRSAQTIRGVDALIALQSVGDAMSGRAKAAKRGHSMLDILEDIRTALLAGVVPQHRLEQLVRMLKEGGLDSGEPELDEVLAEIDLRARVELAKLGQPDP